MEFPDWVQVKKMYYNWYGFCSKMISFSLTNIENLQSVSIADMEAELSNAIKC